MHPWLADARTPPPNPLPQGEGENAVMPASRRFVGPNPLPQGEGENAAAGAHAGSLGNCLAAGGIAMPGNMLAVQQWIASEKSSGTSSEPPLMLT